MPDTPLGKLYRARLRAQRQITKLEPQLEGYRAKLADTEAKIVKLGGVLFLPPHRRANPFFKPGELPRIALGLMKEAACPVPVRYLAARALALRGCPSPTPGIMKQTRKRLSMAMTDWSKRGVVRIVGEGNQAKWELA